MTATNVFRVRASFEPEHAVTEDHVVGLRQKISSFRFQFSK